MMKPALLVVTTLLLLLPALLQADSPAQTTDDPTLDQLAWLAGHWHGGSAGRVTEELWLPPSGGLMLGLNRDVSANGSAFFEYLRIEQTDEGIFYVASPRGAKATAFKMVECSENKAVFENKTHDFPQRITYQLVTTDKLQVTISGDVDGKTESRGWSWTRLSAVASATGGGSK